MRGREREREREREKEREEGGKVNVCPAQLSTPIPCGVY